MAPESAYHLGFVEVVADKAKAALRMEVAAIECDDAGSLLTAMLQGVKAERGQGRGILMAEHAEDTALLAKAIVLVSRQGSRIGTLFDRNLHAGLAKSAVQHQAPPSRLGTRVRGAPWI
jgi:GTPase